MNPLAWLGELVSASAGTGLAGLVAGIGLLWFSSRVIILRTAPIARFFGVTELAITILGVSILSSLPELSVSLAAALRGQASILIGNVIGSNFVTLTFVTAFCALLAPMAIQRETRERESAWMILSSTAILVLSLDGRPSRWDGALLIGLYLPYLASVIGEAHAQAEPQPAAGGDARAGGQGIGRHLVAAALAIAGVVAGAEVAVAGVVAGAEVAVAGGIEVGRELGVSEAVLGGLVFAFGTSLPEFAIAVSATVRRKAVVSISEIYASNIFTAMFVLGVVCLVAPLEIDPTVLRFDLPFLILAGSVVQIFVTTGARLVRLEALAILGLYVYYVLGHFVCSLPISACAS